ncbi:MAG: YeeE/YedE family protein [Gammaproteobacteria bacterium]|nr:YeeE/YedE family protein [Gammaproteobacteria bacterium]MDH5802541.1 YeeE/YedE family protein [Gammaproteobacteria bacterium]
MVTQKLEKNVMWAYIIVGVLALVSIGTYAYNEYYIYLSVYLWFGFVYGMCLQYGRFCFSSAFRDLFAVGVPRMAVGIMIATVLFALVSAFVSATGLSTFHAAPTSVHATIAGFIFGIGMVFAGGCASGSLYKTGEGNGVALIVILSISVTQAIFADVGGWFNKLVPDSWHQSAMSKGLPASINAGDGWVDQYLAGYVWDQPVLTYATMMGQSNDSVTGAFVGNVLIGVIIPATILLMFVYAGWSRRGYMKKQLKIKSKTTFKDEIAGYWTMIMASKRTAIAGLILGIFCGLQMLVTQGLRVKFGVQNAGTLLDRMGFDFGLSVNGTVFDPGYWYVTTQEAQWVGWVFNKMGAENMDNIYFGFVNGIPNPAINPADWMSLALIGGAAVMALLHNEFKFKKPTWELAIWAMIGGALMGIGSRLGLGCNVGAFFVRVSQGDVSGWLFGVGMIGGAYIGVKFFNWWTQRKLDKEFAACGV